MTSPSMHVKRLLVGAFFLAIGVVIVFALGAVSAMLFGMPESYEGPRTLGYLIRGFAILILVTFTSIAAYFLGGVALHELPGGDA